MKSIQVRGAAAHATKLVTAVALMLAATAQAQALAPVTAAADKFTATVVGISLALATGAIGIGGYKIMFAGAGFRDVANLFVGAAVAGGAAGIAALFI